MKAEKKTEVVKVRLTRQEKENLRRAARREYLTISEYVRRNTAIPPDVTRKEFDQIKKDFIYEIRKIGVNINQVAKKYNEYRYTEPRQELLEELARIETLAGQFIKIIRGKGRT